MSKSKTVLDSYEKIAEWYDRRKDYLYEQDWLDKFLSHLKPKSNILDIGCGMGEPIDKYFIDRDFTVTGVDGCSKFIEMAKQCIPQGKFILGDMRDLDLKQRFDGIIAWNSIFHLQADEQKNMFNIFVKHLCDDGILMFTTGSEAGEVWSDNGGENLYHASLAPDEYKQLLNEHGFDLIDYKINDKDCNDHTVWLARYKKL
jgi:cyclopropane fatty-acyl-phospholipid synthase-like methyltransferase